MQGHSTLSGLGPGTLLTVEPQAVCSPQSTKQRVANCGNNTPDFLSQWLREVWTLCRIHMGWIIHFRHLTALLGSHQWPSQRIWQKAFVTQFGDHQPLKTARSYTVAFSITFTLTEPLSGFLSHLLLLRDFAYMFRIHKNLKDNWRKCWLKITVPFMLCNWPKWDVKMSAFV